MMNYEEAKQTCHVRSAIYQTSVGKRYWKNNPVSLDKRVSDSEKQVTDWKEYDPRDDDDTSLFMYND